METKICKKCGIEKKIDNFIKYKKNNKQYIRGICKHCENEQIRKYRENNKDIFRQKRKKYYKENPQLFKKYKEKYKDKRKEWGKKYREENKDKIKEAIKRCYQKYKERRNIKEAERKKEDKIYRLKLNTRLMIGDAFKRKKQIKNNNTTKILCCDIDFFIRYLLQTYKENYGYEWDGKELVHIDHIIPLATAKSEEDIIKLCHYTNLQLLKAKDNMQKGKKLNWGLDKYGIK